MTFKYAAFTVMMPEYSLEEAASLLRELGYDGVEWRVHSVRAGKPADVGFWGANKATVDIRTIVEQAKDVKRISEDQGLEIIGLGTYLSCKLLDDVKRCMEAAAIMGAGSIRVSPPSYDGTVNYNDLYEEALEGYAKVEELAKQFKVRANVELRYSKICSSASLAYRLVSEFDPEYVGVIMDPGNMVTEGYENWQLGLELLGPYLSHVHVKNAAWMEEKLLDDGTQVWKTEMVPLKDGIVNWRNVLHALSKVGFGGWMSFEDFAAGDTKQKLSNDIQYMKSIESELE